MKKIKPIFTLFGMLLFLACNSEPVAASGGVSVGNGKYQSSYGFEIDYPATLKLTQKSDADILIDNSNTVSVGPTSSIEFTILDGTFATLEDLQNTVQANNVGVTFLPIQFSTGPGFYYLVRSPGHVVGHYFLLIAANHYGVDVKIDVYAARVLRIAIS